MQYGISLLSSIPCRKMADNCSEMVTQLLFGEIYSVVEATETWLKILTAYDNYECWINIKQHHRISEANFKQLQKAEPLRCGSVYAPVTDKLKEFDFPITLGARLPFISQGKMNFDDLKFEFNDTPVNVSEKKGAKNIIQTAKLFLNSPYLWGGKTPFGIDCSGFTQVVYMMNGYQLPRDAAQQVEKGSPLSFAEEAEAGDLAFFDNEEGKIVHVGILIDNEHIIHASGNVRIDRFDHYGIHHSDRKKYSHTLRVIKRVI
jgi:hypothetical protein